MPTRLFGSASGLRSVISSFLGRTLKRLKGCSLAWEYLNSPIVLPACRIWSLSSRKAMILSISFGCAAIVPLMPSGARSSVPQMDGAFSSV